MPFTEMCARSGGSNLNSGTRTGNSTVPGTAADFTYTGLTWVQATRTLTRATGSFVTDGFAVDDFVSIYPDAATVSPYIAAITTVTGTTIVTSATRKAGTAPVDGTANTSVKLGGAWKGPNAAENFPFGFILNTLTNAAGDRPRVNFKNDATYSITAAITHNMVNHEYIQFQGFTTSYADGGRCIIDGGTTGASYVLLTIGGAAQWIILEDFEFQNNGATGSADGTLLSANCRRVVCHDVRGSGLVPNADQVIWQECEAYSCNQSNTANKGGFAYGGTILGFVRCIAHDNTGSNTRGFYINGNVRFMENCIADSNGNHGIEIAGIAAGTNRIFGCDLYNNGGSGLRFTTTGSAGLLIANNNFVKNATYGMDLTGGPRHGWLSNNGYGSGTQANTSGQNNLAAVNGLTVSGAVTYATDVTPWTDPANGDFRVSLAAAKGAGRGSFLQTQASYAGTLGYPDIGAAQHLDAGGGSPVGQCST